MEQNKWMMVRRETTFEKFKRKVKNFIFNFFGIEEVTEGKNRQKHKDSKIKSQNIIQKNNVPPKNIIVPVNIKTENKLKTENIKSENINSENDLNKDIEIIVEIVS